MTLAAAAFTGPGWALPRGARDLHYFAGIESSCGRYVARPGLDYIDDPPRERRCQRCQYNAFGRAAPRDVRAAVAGELPAELALAMARNITKGRRPETMVRVSVGTLKRLVQLAEAPAKEASE